MTRFLVRHFTLLMSYSKESKSNIPISTAVGVIVYVCWCLIPTYFIFTCLNCTGQWVHLVHVARARTPACCAPEIWATQEGDDDGGYPERWGSRLVEGESYSTLAETLGNEAAESVTVHRECPVWGAKTWTCSKLMILYEQSRVKLHIEIWSITDHFRSEFGDPLARRNRRHNRMPAPNAFDLTIGWSILFTSTSSTLFTCEKFTF